jgi:hypothetical protein
MSRQLGEIFMDLSFGPLAGLSIGNEVDGSIGQNHESRVVHLINSGLREIYSRFLLSEKELVIRARAGRSLYTLERVHGDAYIDSDNPGNEPEKYIVDTLTDPYQEDWIRMLHAYGPRTADTDESEKLPELKINDYESEEPGVFTPAVGVIQIPEPVEGGLYYFLYQARHPLLGIGEMTQRVRLPALLYGALESWVAAKIFLSMNGAEHRARGQELENRYEVLCQRALEEDLTLTSLSFQNNKAEARGFV